MHPWILIRETNPENSSARREFGGCPIEEAILLAVGGDEESSEELGDAAVGGGRSEEHTSELQSL